MLTLKKKLKVEKDHLDSLDILEVDDDDSIGVLLSDRIEHYANKHKLIKPFCPENLKPAAYELTIGNEFYLGGKYHKFVDKENPQFLEIPPFQVAVLKTAERICLPRFLIARWNIRVRHAYDGLLWVGAAQVDPGYKGHLFCPIYNLSNKPRRLYMGQKLAVIDFVKTTEFVKGKSREYPSNTRPIIEKFKAENLKSALFTDAADKIDSFQHVIESIENRVTYFTTFIFGLLAIVITILIGFAGIRQKIELSISSWSSIIVFFSIFVLFITTFSYITRRSTTYLVDRVSSYLGYRIPKMRRIFRRNWWIAIILSYFGASAFALAAFWIAESHFSQATSGNVATKAEVERLSSDLRYRIKGNASALKKEMKMEFQKELSAKNRKIIELEKRIMNLESIQKR